jgi:DNA invertase Pin-like site-specific DNA recombinase
MLAAMAEIERSNIRERQMAGIRRAKAEGRCLGRPKKSDAAEIKRWREENEASISKTAKHFEVSESTVKRAKRGEMLRVNLLD